MNRLDRALLASRRWRDVNRLERANPLGLPGAGNRPELDCPQGTFPANFDVFHNTPSIHHSEQNSLSLVEELGAIAAAVFMDQFFDLRPHLVVPLLKLGSHAVCQPHFERFYHFCLLLPFC